MALKHCVALTCDAYRPARLGAWPTIHKGLVPNLSPGVLCGMVVVGGLSDAAAM